MVGIELYGEGADGQLAQSAKFTVLWLEVMMNRANIISNPVFEDSI